MDPEKTPRERAEDLISLLVSDWRPTPRQGLWAIRIGIVLGLLVVIGYPYDVTLWDWIKLLIVPAAIAGAGLWYNTQQRARELQLADQRAQTDRENADQSRQDDALQAYLDGMSQLLTDKDQPLHRVQVGDSLSTVARARTLTVLARLDSNRKGTVVRFLYEAGLIGWRQPIVDEDEVHMDSDTSIVDLRGADLAGANLDSLDLRGVYLRDCNMFRVNLYSAKLSDAYLRKCSLHEADLRSTDLYEADLQGANLDFADLRYADLGGADLRGTSLEEANLRGVRLDPRIPEDARTLEHIVLGPTNLHYTNLDGAKLQGARLKRADLEGASLEGANLEGASLYRTDLSGANLEGAKGITNEELEDTAASLEGATMPNGQKYENWLKDKEARRRP